MPIDCKRYLAYGTADTIQANGNRLPGVAGSAVTAAKKVEICATFVSSCGSFTIPPALRTSMETLPSGRGYNCIVLTMPHNDFQRIKFAYNG